MQDKSKTKEIKRVRQKTGSYCGPAVFEMLVSSLGLELSQESMVDAADVRGTVMKQGVPLTQLVTGLKKLYPELRVWKKNDAKIEEIESLLAKGYPVGVNWQGVFDRDEYGDDEDVSRWEELRNKLARVPELKGTQGHYSIVLEVNSKKGFLRFADPYGHFAGKDRFISTWEFEDRWWDDVVEEDERGRKKYIFENRLMFLVTTAEDENPGKLGMREV